MINPNLLTPILMIALDSLEFKDAKTLQALSLANGGITQAEQLEQEKAKMEQAKSDIALKTTRVVIPINDRLLPIHYTAGDSSSSSLVNYHDGTPSVVKRSHQYNISFEVNTEVAVLSTICAILEGISKKVAVTEGKPRVSFFAPTIAIMNAYLTGITKTSVQDSSQQLITLSLEVAPEEQNSAEKEAVGSIAKEATPMTSGELQMFEGGV